MAYGTPSTRDDVEAYYTRIRHGHAPSAEQLDDLIRRYDAIGGISPLAERTAAQVTAVANELERRDPGQFVVVFGSKYEPPLIEDACASLLAVGITRVIAVVLAPHTSALSTGQYFDRARSALGPAADLVEIGAWWSEPQFVHLIAERVTEALSQLDEKKRRDARVIFTAHSLPVSAVTTNDSYREQLAASAELAARAAGIQLWDVAWQSAGRTADERIGPDILVALTQLAQTNVRDVVVCPIGFVADHLEVLYDLDIQASEHAAKLGLGFSRTVSLNDDSRLMNLLADLVVQKSS